MMTMTRAIAATIGMLAVAACGDDTTSSTGGGGSAGDGGSQTGVGGSQTGAGGSQTGAGGSQTGVGGSPSGVGGTDAGGGPGVGGGGQTGCVNDPTVCTGGLICCSGVPYPPEGICQPVCNMQSDRAIKHDVRPVDGDRVLEQLAGLEVSRWRYDASPEREHIGPMAQDFRAAFGLGGDGRHIATVDANGVTMAAVSALYQRVLRLEAQAATREQDNRALVAEIARLKSALGETRSAK